MASSLARRLGPALLVLSLAAAPGCASWRAARLYQSGTRALDAGRVDEAVRALRTAADLAPFASEVHNHLGLAEAAAGDEAAARRAWQRAIALDCGNEAARHNLMSLEARSVPREAP